MSIFFSFFSLFFLYTKGIFSFIFSFIFFRLFFSVRSQRILLFSKRRAGDVEEDEQADARGGRLVMRIYS